jgi:hypothetical protein
MDLLTTVVLGVSGIVSLACELFLWRGEGSWLRKLAWTPVVLIPAFGPILFGGLYRVPPVQDEVDRARQSSMDA